MDSHPKKLVKANSTNKSSLVSEIINTEREDEDPLSIKDSSINFLGIFLAIMTFLLPILGILLDRPLPRDNGITNIQNNK